MLHNTKVKTILALAALSLSALSHGNAASITDRGLHFQNDTGHWVDVYVDGRRVVDNAAPGTTGMFPIALTAGEHEVTITPWYRAPGEQDLHRKVLAVSPDDTRLTFKSDGALKFETKTGKFSLDDFTTTSSGG